MLRSNQVYFALALVTTVAVGCGGSTNTVGTGGHGGGTTSASSTSSSSTSTTSSSSTSSSSGMICPPGEATVFALTKLDWGEGTNGQWKAVGFNIDGLVSTGLSTDLCKPNAGGMASVVYPDGNQGIDNSFGKNLLPTLLSLDPTWVTDIDKSIQNGNFNALLKAYCLPPTGDATAFTTKLFGGTSLGMMARFDGTDMWPVAPDLLTNPKDPESSSIVFPQSSVTGTTFSIGKNQTLVLTIPVNLQGTNTSIKLTLYAAQLTMTLSADRKSATVGMIGGALNTEEFVAEIKKLGYAMNLCNSQLLNGLITLVRQASDIMADGSQDPSKTCDGISIGFTFEMSAAQLGGVGPAQPVAMSCL